MKEVCDSGPFWCRVPRGSGLHLTVDRLSPEQSAANPLHWICPMNVQIPVSAKQVDPSVPLGDPPVPLNDLIVDLFQVQTDGRIAKDLGRATVVNGVAHFDAPPSPRQLRWA